MAKKKKDLEIIDTVEIDNSIPEPDGVPTSGGGTPPGGSIVPPVTPAAGGGTTPPPALPGAGGAATGPCDQPIFSYEALVGKSEKESLAIMRWAYEAKLTACRAQPVNSATVDAVNGFVQALTNINNSMVDIDDGVPTDKTDLFTTFYGPTKDKLDPRTRRSQPFGTVITEMDGYKDGIPIRQARSCIKYRTWRFRT